MTIIRQLFLTCQKFGYNFYTNNHGVFKVEAPNLVMLISKDAVEIESNKFNMTLHPYDIGILTNERTTDIHVNEFERERKFSALKFKLNFYMGRTVGVNVGVVCSLEIDKNTGEVTRVFNPCKTNVYNKYCDIDGRAYEDVLKLGKMASNISITEYRNKFKVNLGYIDKSIDDVVRVIKKLIQYIPDNAVPNVCINELRNLKFIKRYESDNSELYMCGEYYVLNHGNGKRYFFKVNEDCYKTLKINNIMLNEYANDRNGMHNVRVIGDKKNKLTQFIVLFEYNGYEIIFNFLNNLFYIKVNNFLIDCTDTFIKAFNRLDRIVQHQDANDKCIEIKNMVY